MITREARREPPNRALHFYMRGIVLHETYAVPSLEQLRWG